MSTIISFLSSVFLFVFYFFTCEAFDLVEECKRTDDGHVTRGNFTCCLSSPRSLPLHSSLDFESGWKKCAVGKPNKANEDPVISAWRVYRCLIFQGIYGKPLLPSTFTNFMTSKYPALIKSQISQRMSELEDETMKFEVDVECLKRTPYPKVHLLRNLFYATEQEICEAGDDTIRRQSSSLKEPITPPGSRPAIKALNVNSKHSTSITSTDMSEMLCETCDRRKEMYHRNGDCCSHVPLPFPFIQLPYRYGNQDRVSQCTEDLVDDVGLPTDSEYSTHLQYLCIPSCEYYLSGTLEESDLWVGERVLQSPKEIKALIGKMTPTYFSPKYKAEVMNYVLRNFRTAWTETKTFESRIQLSQMDSRNCDKGKLKNLLASCKTHRLIETVTTLYLNNLCLELYPLTDSNTALSKNGTFGHVHKNNKTSRPNNNKPAASDDEVTLNFQWGTPNRNQNRGHHHSSHQNKNKFDDSDYEDELSSYMGHSFRDIRNSTTASKFKH